MNNCTCTKAILATALSATLLSSLFLSPTALYAQALEEIIVTAQRREQSLQEVPISIEAFSGQELQQQGYRTMDELAEFSPSVEIELRMQDQNVSIRGVGTAGGSLALEQAAPTFVDGIVFSRTSMIKGAFVDLERIEVLRGPQPVFFGQNAVAGAFSLVTRKPTEEWKGNVVAEVGNFGRMSVEGGIGGPLTETLGIRVAGKYDDLDGYITDVLTGDKFPERTDTAGRLTLQWKPTDAFVATVKVGISDTESGSEPMGFCLGANADLSPAELEALGIDRDGGVALGIDALVPGRTSFDELVHQLPVCGTDNTPYGKWGLKSPDVWFQPPPDVAQVDTRGTGFVDIREVGEQIRRETHGVGLEGRDDFKSTDGYLDLRYTLANGIELGSVTSYIDYYRLYHRINSYSPFYDAARIRDEDLQQTSQEFRVTSPAGGNIEWMLGVYWQDNDLDLVSDSFGANMRRPRRYNIAWEDATWKSAFAAVTFNFMDDKASIDIGGRFTDVEKEAYIKGWGARWVFAEEPTGGCDALPECERVVTTEGIPGYTLEWRERRMPSNWSSPAKPIGYTALDPDIRRTPGPVQDTITDSEFDPQVVLRYRPNEDLSLYAKYATAFKAGGFDTGVSSLGPLEEFSFGPEQAKIWELGVKGAFWNGRARYDASLFTMDVDGLQLATILTDIGNAGATNVAQSLNAGLQRIRGLEFSIDAALTDNLRGRLVGALMDGEMVDYQGAGCTVAEFLFADTGPCVSEAESAAFIADNNLVDENGDPLDDDTFAGTIDRSGSPAPRIPDWKFALKLDYSRPLMSGYMGFAGINVSFSDGYITNIEEFDLVQKAGKHSDVNLSVGFGDADGRWRLSAWARNLMENQEEYNPEFDVAGDGIVFEDMAASMYTSYGLQFEYNYN